MKVLRYEVQRQQRHVLGSSALDYNDIYSKLQPFLRQWKASCQQGRELHPYIVSCDLSSAFNQVQISCIMKVVKALLKNSEYVIPRYAAVVPSLNGVHTAYMCQAFPQHEEFLGLARLLRFQTVGKQCSVIVDQVGGCDSHHFSVLLPTTKGLRMALHLIGRLAPGFSCALKYRAFWCLCVDIFQNLCDISISCGNTVLVCITGFLGVSCFGCWIGIFLLWLLSLFFWVLAPIFSSIDANAFNIFHHSCLHIHGKCMHHLLSLCLISLFAQAWCQTARRQDVVKLIHEHLECNLIKCGNQWYRQEHGIAQGGILSTLLCSLFLADLETQHLRGILFNPHMVENQQGSLWSTLKAFLSCWMDSTASVVISIQPFCRAWMLSMHSCTPSKA